MNFRRIWTITAAAAMLLVAVGGLVRATGSGLGCLDEWPTCRGGWTAPPDAAGIIEYSHRAGALLVGLLLVVGVASAFRGRVRPSLRRASVLALVVIVVQAGLGAVVVRQGLHATWVTAHLLLGLALVGLTTGIAVAAALGPPTTPNTKLSKMTRGALAGAALLFVVGAMVRERGAGLAFADWPLMNGSVIPNFSIEVEALHWLHRILAVAMLGHVSACFFRARRDGSRPTRILSSIVLALFVAQVLIGGANVLTQLSVETVLAHVAVGALTWAALVALAVAARRQSTMPLVLTKEDLVGAR